MARLTRQPCRKCRRVACQGDWTKTRLWQRLKREGRLETESSGNNTQAVLNFKTRLNREFLQTGYRELEAAGFKFFRGSYAEQATQFKDRNVDAVFTFLAVLVDIPLGVLIPSSSGHGALAMPLLAPLADFAQVGRATTITAWIMGHGLALIVAPTSVVVVGGLAIARVGYDKYLRFVWPLWLAMFAVATAIVAVAATVG